MKLLLVPELVPSVGWLALASSSAEVWLDLFETFPKQTLRNRFYILTSQGPASITIPVVKDSRTITRDVQIDYTTNWPKQVTEALAAAYRKAPFYEAYEQGVNRLFNSQYECLVAMQAAMLSFCLDAIRLQVTVRQTQDFRQVPHEVVDATEVISKTNYFENGHLVPYAQCFTDASWPESRTYLTRNQSKRGFVAGLSCLDLIFNTGPEARNYIPLLTI